MTSFRSFAQGAIWPFVLGLMVGGLCWLTAGFSLGFYLGGVALLAAIVPPLVVGRSSAFGVLLAAGGVIDAIGLVWLIAVFHGDADFGQWIECYLVLAAMGIATGGVAWALRRLIGPTLAAAMTTTLALAWLLWPVWLSPHLSGDVGAAVASWLSPAHPLLAINRVRLDLGAWTQQRLMYQHTSMGQDVPLALPRTVWPCVVLLAAMGLVLMWIGNLYRGELKEPPPVETSPTPSDS